MPAERLKARVAGFEDFPPLCHGQVSFTSMLRPRIDGLRQRAAP